MSGVEITCENGILTLSGVIDHVSVMQLIQPGQKYIADAEDRIVIVDWAQITYANSAALAMLLQWTRQAQAAEKSIHSRNTPEFLVQLAHLSQLEFLFA